MKTCNCDDHLPYGHVYISGKDLAFSAGGPSFSVRSIIITLFLFCFFYSGWSLGVAIPSFAERLAFSMLHCKAGNVVRAYMSQATL